MGQGLQENTDLKFSSRNLIDVALTVAQGGEWHVYECEGKKEKREEENEVLRMTMLMAVTLAIMQQLYAFTGRIAKMY